MSFLFTRHKTEMPAPEDALPGREAAMPVPELHDVLGTPIKPPFPQGLETLVVGMGCFWGAERIFWKAPGVYTTAVPLSVWRWRGPLPSAGRKRAPRRRAWKSVVFEQEVSSR